MRDRNLFGLCARSDGLVRCLVLIAPQHGESFFICQPHVRKDVVDRLDRALKTETLTNFLQSQIRLFGNQSTQLTAMRVENDGLASATMMLGSYVAGMTTLLDELFDHAKRDFKPTGDLLARRVSSIIGFENPLP